MSQPDPTERSERPILDTPVTPSVRAALSNIATELHNNTHAVGRLAAELGEVGARVTSLESAFRGMRQRLKSIPAEVEATAEDTANHRIEILEKKLEAERVAARLSEANSVATKAKADLAEIQRMTEARRKAWERRGWTAIWTIVGTVASAFAEHYFHVLPR